MTYCGPAGKGKHRCDLPEGLEKTFWIYIQIMFQKVDPGKLMIIHTTVEI